MILQRALAAAGDEDDLLDPGRQRLFDRILDQRLVDDGQHLLGHRLGGGQKPCAQPRDGEDGLADGTDRHRTRAPCCLLTVLSHPATRLASATAYD